MSDEEFEEVLGGTPTTPLRDRMPGERAGSREPPTSRAPSNGIDKMTDRQLRALVS